MEVSDDVHEGVLEILRYWFNEMDPGCSQYFSLKNANAVATFHETVYFDTFDNSTEQSRKAHEYYCDAIDYLKELLLTRALLSCTQAIDTLKLRHLAFHSLRGDIHMLQGNYWNAIEDFKTATKKSINNLHKEKIRWASRAYQWSVRKNYYSILNLPSNPTEQDVKRNYKILALKWHPDKHELDTIEIQNESSMKMLMLNEAKDVLLDPIIRLKYDRGYYNIEEEIYGVETNMFYYSSPYEKPPT